MEWKYHLILSLMEDAWCFFLHIVFFLQKLTTILELQHQTPIPESIYSRSVQYPRDREVHHNAAYDSTLDCEELQSVGVESKDVP